MIKKIQLRNNVKIFLQESHRAPVVSIQVWVKTGSADEKKCQEGLTHFIEHLLFKGTDKFGTGEIAKMVESSGGEINAYTSFDQTVYYITISSKYYAQAIEALSQMLGAPTFEAQEIDNERGVVLEEIKRSNDSPGRESSKLLFSTVYKAHPYGRPVIGYPEIIEKSTRQKIVDLFRSRYAPDNVFVVVAGDFDPKVISKQLQKFELLKGKIKSVKRVTEPEQKNPRIGVKQTEFNESYLNLAWRLDETQNDNIVKRDLLAILLGGGDSSRLVKKLRLENSVVNTIGASVFYALDPGFFAISATLNAENLERVLKKIEEEIFDICVFAPEKNEIDMAITNIKSTEVYSLESVESLASHMGRNVHLFNDPDFFKKYISRLEEVRPVEISHAAREILGVTNLSVSYLTNMDSYEAQRKIDNWISSFQDSFFDATNQYPEPSKKDVKTVGPKKAAIRVSNIFKKNIETTGAKVVYKTEIESLVGSIYLGFLGGERAVAPAKAGLSDFLSAVWATGTKQKSENEIIRIIESNAASIRPFAGRNSFGIGVDFLSEHQVPVVDLMFEIATDIVFKDEIIERERQILIENLKAQNDRPFQIVYQNFLREIFNGHPYALNPKGSIDTIQNIEKKDLVDYWKSYVNASNLTAVVVGGVDIREIKEKIKKSFKKDKKFDTKIPPPEFKSSVVEFQKLDKEQSHLIYGFRGLSLNDDRRYVLQLIQAVLSGQGGRLFYNLREKKSLAYSISPIKLEGIDAGCFGIYIGCSPEKVKTALEMIKIEIENLTDKLISDMEIERSKRYLIGHHDIHLQSAAARAGAILSEEMYENDSEDVFRYSEKINSVSKEDIQRLAQELFTKPSVTVLVGPVNTLADPV